LTVLLLTVRGVLGVADEGGRRPMANVQTIAAELLGGNALPLADKALSAPYAVSFDDIVKAHHVLDGPAPASNGNRAHAHAQLQQLWKQFESREGSLESSFFGTYGTTGAALTSHLQPRGRFPFRRPAIRPRLHVALNLASADHAAELVSRYERIRLRADTLLCGDESENVMRLVYDRVCRLIRIIDQMLALDELQANAQLTGSGAIVFANGAATAAESPARESPAATRRRQADEKARRKALMADVEKKVSNALLVARTEASQAEDLCTQAVRRSALMAYFVGMLFGVVVFTVLGFLFGQLLSSVSITGFNLQRFETVFIAGAVGAVVSVMSRMSSDESWLEYETGRSYLRLLGMFRPLIGAIFGVALYVGITSGVLQFIKPPSDPNAVFFFFAFIAFLAGFSERWARDILVPPEPASSSSRAAGGSAGAGA
jgi:hypothetical protein